MEDKNQDFEFARFENSNHIRREVQHTVFVKLEVEMNGSEHNQ